MKNMKDKKNMKTKEMNKMSNNDRTPTYLLILIALLVLIAFAVITISANMKESKSNGTLMQEYNQTVDEIEEDFQPNQNGAGTVNQ